MVHRWRAAFMAHRRCLAKLQYNTGQPRRSSIAAPTASGELHWNLTEVQRSTNTPAELHANSGRAPQDDAARDNEEEEEESSSDEDDESKEDEDEDKDAA